MKNMFAFLQYDSTQSPDLKTFLSERCDITHLVHVPPLYGINFLFPLLWLYLLHKLTSQAEQLTRVFPIK